jgi:hypothetical protein
MKLIEINKEVMKEKKHLYEQALALLEDCNDKLKEDALLPTINSLMASVVKNLNEVMIKELTGINPNDIK